VAELLGYTPEQGEARNGRGERLPDLGFQPSPREEENEGEEE
jgi:hypothetical protein